jgi:hypothetical protein
MMYKQNKAHSAPSLLVSSATAATYLLCLALLSLVNPAEPSHNHRGKKFAQNLRQQKKQGMTNGLKDRRSPEPAATALQAAA